MSIIIVQKRGKLDCVTTAKQVLAEWLTMKTMESDALKEEEDSDCLPASSM